MKLKALFSILVCQLIVLSACARTAIRPGVTASRRVQFQLSVQGQFALNREDVTYYIVINAPDEQKDVTLDPATQGPRMNGTSLNDPPTFLIGRLPFTGKLPGDVDSIWTDFYYIRGSADGNGVVGRAIRRPDGTPEIVQPNYPAALWRVITPNTIEIQMVFSDLFAKPDQLPKNIVLNLGTSDSIDTGQGYLFDRWRSNIPFSIDTAANNTQIQDQDADQQLIMRQIPGKFIPQLPSGVNAADVNIVGYQYKVIEL